MKKYVNGILVDLTPAEIAQREAEELAEKYKDNRKLAVPNALLKEIRTTLESNNVANNKSVIERCKQLAMFESIFKNYKLSGDALSFWGAFTAPVNIWGVLESDEPFTESNWNELIAMLKLNDGRNDKTIVDTVITIAENWIKNFKFKEF